MYSYLKVGRYILYYLETRIDRQNTNKGKNNAPTTVIEYLPGSHSIVSLLFEEKFLQQQKHPSLLLSSKKKKNISSALRTLCTLRGTVLPYLCIRNTTMTSIQDQFGVFVQASILMFQRRSFPLGSPTREFFFR